MKNILRKIYNKVKATRIKEGDYPSAEDFIEVIEDNYEFITSQDILLDRILACGYFGCVFRTKNEGWVAKITADFYEYLLVDEVFHKPLPGFALYKDVRNLNSEHWLFIREEIIPLEKSKKRDVKKIKDDLLTIVSIYLKSFGVDQPHYDYVEPLDPFDAFEIMESISLETFPIANSLRKMFESGFLIGDLHIKNVGLSKRDNRLLFYDAQIHGRPSEFELERYKKRKESGSIW
jgi:hypothetical protein